MNKCDKFLLFLLILIQGSLAIAVQEDEAQRLYLDAKKRSFNQQWDMAAQLYQQIVNDFPKSHYREEAQFWVGYCEEKAGDYRSAFLAFSTLERSFPQSTWLDDAVQHKIVLAEKLAAQRGDQYYTFLRGQLNNKNNDIKYQAALALGRLGDKRAAPVLTSLRGHVDFDAETEGLIARLDQAQAVPDEAVYAENTIGSFAGDETATTRINPKDEKVNYFAEHRFEQYKAMARRDNNWSTDELNRFGLWHILPTDDFDAYTKMDDSGKSEWLRIFWKRQDPTPTTDRNESKEEFDMRVNIAHQFFSYYDGMAEFYYAPWDARGEIYIKFGQPANRTTAEDGEFWTYPRYDQVTFFIRPNVTNIFGRSIFISALHGRSMRSVPRTTEWSHWRYFHNRYIFNPGFYYEYQPQDGATLVRDLQVQVLKKSPGLAFRYTLPAAELNPYEKDGLYHLSYLERYVVFDKTMHEVVKHETTRRITKPSSRDFKSQKVIEQEIQLNLDPGEYNLGLSIEDPFSKKVGVQKLDFQVK